VDPYQGARPQSPGWMKAAVGCAIGCGVVVLLGVVAVGVGGWWALSPGRQHPTNAIASPTAEGAFQVGDLGKDPGFTALLDHFVRETQRQQQQGLPPWMRQLQQAGQAGSSPSAGLRMMLPRQATFSLEEPADGGEPALLVAVNPRGLTRLLRTMLPDDAIHDEHRGQRLMRFSDDGYGALVDGTFLFASEEPALRGGIDRLLDRSGSPPPDPVELGAPSRAWDLTGTVDNSRGTLAEVLLGERREVPGMRRALVGVDLADRDLMTGRVVVECSGPEAAEAAIAGLAALVEKHGAELAEHGLELRSVGRRDPRGAVLDWELHGFAAAVTHWAAEAGADDHSPNRPAVH
jgi:hypothetical protein